MRKPLQETKKTTNPKVYKRSRRAHIANKKGECSICPPHKGENRRYKKRGVKKPRYKDKR